MKAIIISSEAEIIKALDKKLKNEGYDIIVYRWLLKALDNVEEIQPDLVVMHACEFPRQWKTLASYVQSGIGGSNVKICLYDTTSLSDEDKEKARQLKVELWNAIDDKKSDSFYSLILTHPLDQSFVFGTAVLIEKDVYECKINRNDFMLKQQIKYISLSEDDKKSDTTTAALLSFSGEVQSFSNGTIVIRAKNYYEK